MLKGSALYSIALFGQRIGSLVLLTVYTRYLNPSDFGTLDILENTTSILSLVLGANFSATLVYFYSNREREDGERVAAGTALAGAAILGAVASGIGWSLVPWCEQWLFGKSGGEPYFQLMFAGLAVGFVIEALFAWLRVANLASLFVAFSLGRLVIGVSGTALMLVFYRWGLLGALWSNLVTALLTAGALGILFWRRMGFAFDRAIFLKMLQFAIPLSLSGIALFIIHFADRFFLKTNSSLETIGLYSLGYKIAMMLSFAHSAFHTYWVSQVVRIMEREDGLYVAGRAFTYMTAALTFCALGLSIMSVPLLGVLATPAYQRAADFIPLLVLAYLVRAFGDFFRSFLIVQKRPGVDSWLNWLGAAICLLGYITLIPAYGPWGAAWATLGGFSVVLIGSLVWLQRTLPLPFEWGRLGILGLAAALTIGLHLVVPSGGKVWTWIAGGISMAVYPGIIFALGFLSAGERSKLQEIFQGRLAAWRRN